MTSAGDPITDRARRARSFGAVVDAYDRIRPGYPAELFDDILTYAVPPVARVLEVGAGTGRATAELVVRGLSVHAIEPDPAMAARLRVSCPGVEVTQGSFEDQPADRGYDLLVSAQAWHWVDPQLRWARAVECLRPGGALALFWNHDHTAEPELTVRIQDAHDRWTPGIEMNARLPEDEVVARWPADFEAEVGGFEDFGTQLYRWQRTLTGPEYVELLSTMSKYGVQPDDARRNLFAELTDLVGETVIVAMDTVLHLGRRKG